MKKLFQLFIRIFIVIGVIVGIIYTVKGYILYRETKTEYSMTETFETLKNNPDFISMDELPEIYKKSVLVVEDKRFYSHHGFDFLATARALANDIYAFSYVEGGSTITQQLAKNMFFSQEKKIERKVAELFMAFDIEQHYSKNEIFEFYVNSIYFGEGYYGISAASEGYYDVSPSDMSDYQATLLAGVPNAPSVYAPTVNPDLAHQRQQQVLKALVRNRDLTAEEAKQIAVMYIIGSLPSKDIFIL